MWGVEGFLSVKVGGTGDRHFLCTRDPRPFSWPWVPPFAGSVQSGRYHQAEGADQSVQTVQRMEALAMRKRTARLSSGKVLPRTLARSYTT